MSDTESLHTPDAAQRGGAEALRKLRAAMAARLHGRDLRALVLYASMPGLSAVNAVVGLLLPALLGPAEFGHYAIAVTLFQYGLILDFGLSQLLDRRLPVLLAEGALDRMHHFAHEVLWARLYVALAALVAGAALLTALAHWQRLPFSLPTGLLSLAAGLGFMVALGPMSVWRATARRSRFAGWNSACAVVLAAGRPIGMVLGGLVGCFGLLAAGYAILAVRLQATMPLPAADRPSPRRTASLLAQGVPLFATSFIWAFYMTANRWVVSFMASQVELGQFAFGANVTYLIVGTVGALAQLHYPSIVSKASSGAPYAVSGAIARDLCWLAVLVALPTAVGIVAGPRLLDMFYPSFAGAEAPLRALLVAVPASVVASWLMPLSLSTASRPWIEGVAIYPAALLVLTGATWAGFQLGGIGGAAWGLTISAMPLTALQIANLRLTGLVRLDHACRILGITALATGGLAILALLT